MHCLSPAHPCQRVVVMKSAQVGFWPGFIIHHAPGPALAVQPTVELAKRFSQQRVDPLIEDSPVLREKMSMVLHRHGAAILRVKGLLHFQGVERPIVVQGVQHLVHKALHLDA